MSSGTRRITTTRTSADPPASQERAAGAVAAGPRSLRPAIFRELPGEPPDDPSRLSPESAEAPEA